MKAGRRTPRNPLILEVMRDYGYVEARGMGVRTKVIPLTRQLTGIDPVFEDGDDFLNTTIYAAVVPENVSEMSLETNAVYRVRPDNVPGKPFQGQLLSLIERNPRITYDQLAQRTGQKRKTIQRYIQALKQQGSLRRIGPSKGGLWEVDGMHNDRLRDK